MSGSDGGVAGDGQAGPDPAALLGDPYVDAVRKSLKQAADELREEESRDVLVFVVGEANAGKSSLINALLGEGRAEVKAIAGWTKESTLYRYAEHLYVVDTPGLNEVDTAELGQGVVVDVQDRADIILYVVNLTGTRSVGELAAYREIRRLDRPALLVANKVDQIPPEERAEVLDDLSRRFEVPPPEIHAVSARTAEGVETLSLKIFQILEKHGRGLLWAKNARHRDALVRNLVITSAFMAAGVGASPVPFSDILPLTAIQSRMWIKVGRIYGYEISREMAKGIIATVATGSAGRAVFRQVLKTVGAATGVGAVATSTVAATIAGAMTYGLGIAAQEYYRGGRRHSEGELKNIYRAAAQAFRLSNR